MPNAGPSQRSAPIWVVDWRIAVTLLGWVTLVKGVEKIAFPDRNNTKAPL